MKDTAIEWAENTINFFMGCTKVSPGCEKCYMYRLMPRFGRDPYKVNKMNWKNIERNLKKWQPSRIFVNSMSDTFHKDVTDDEINEMFAIMQTHDKHQYLVLTKRIERAYDFFYGKSLPENIWLGTSVESEKYIKRIQHLQGIDAKVRFISFEPLLNEINGLDLSDIQWVIVGGESDPKPRGTKEKWVNIIHEECKSKSIPFFFKQWGGKSKCKCHKAWGCRLLKGKTWDELPVITC